MDSFVLITLVGNITTRKNMDSFVVCGIYMRVELILLHVHTYFLKLFFFYYYFFYKKNDNVIKITQQEQWEGEPPDPLPSRQRAPWSPWQK